MNSKKKRNQKKSANPETLTLVPQSVESVERETRSKRKEEGFGLEKSQSRTLNPRRSSREEEQCKSPNPNSPHQFEKEKNNSNPKGKKKRNPRFPFGLNPRTNPNSPQSVRKREDQSKSKRRGRGRRKGKGKEQTSPCVGMALRRRGRRRADPGGSCSPGSAKGAPRPGRSTAACSPVGEHARRRGGRRWRQGSPWPPALLSSLAAARWRLSSLRLRREKERRERKGKSRMT